jgi:hypothetical protein
MNALDPVSGEEDEMLDVTECRATGRPPRQVTAGETLVSRTVPRLEAGR